MKDTTLPPALASHVRCPNPDDDEDHAPPWLGERYRDTLHHMHRANFEAQQDDKDMKHD
ncbi:hypothetical protein [Dyella terrae]|uniref:hypothetical protein n=1 Tax=Dyella terrae TaxID=522259 RepID=UPI001EFE2B5E|nr:hypothetical protein [Dyella terrae]ULU26621.1 hypothetical protein DYST_03567 [Dyella terrae]